MVSRFALSNCGPVMVFRFPLNRMLERNGAAAAGAAAKEKEES